MPRVMLTAARLILTHKTKACRYDRQVTVTVDSEGRTRCMPRVSRRVRRARFSRKEVWDGSEGGGPVVVGSPGWERAFSVSASMICTEYAALSCKIET